MQDQSGLTMLLNLLNIETFNVETLDDECKLFLNEVILKEVDLCYDDGYTPLMSMLDN